MLLLMMLMWVLVLQVICRRRVLLLLLQGWRLMIVTVMLMVLLFMSRVDWLWLLVGWREQRRHQLQGQRHSRHRLRPRLTLEWRRRLGRSDFVVVGDAEGGGRQPLVENLGLPEPALLPVGDAQQRIPHLSSCK
jgi:hypothetical protein